MNKFFEAVDTSAKNSFPSIFKADHPRILYQYTSLPILPQKILEGNCIRFTHVNFMNDREEMRYGLAMFYQLMDLIIKNENDERIRYFLHVLKCSIIADFESRKKGTDCIRGLRTILLTRIILNSTGFLTTAHRKIFMLPVFRLKTPKLVTNVVYVCRPWHGSLSGL